MKLFKVVSIWVFSVVWICHQFQSSVARLERAEMDQLREKIDQLRNDEFHLAFNVEELVAILHKNIDNTREYVDEYINKNKELHENYKVLDNEIKEWVIYAEALEEWKEYAEKLRKENYELRKNAEELGIENVDLKTENADLKKENVDLNAEAKTWHGCTKDLEKWKDRALELEKWKDRALELEKYISSHMKM